MHPLAMLLLGIYLFVQGLDYLGFKFNGQELVKGICLTLAGLVICWDAL